MKYSQNIKYVAINLLQKNLSWKDFESLRIYFQNLNGNPPIIIYTAGKVGSTTVYQSLKRANLDNPIYHIHSLTEFSIKQAKEKYKKAGKNKEPRFLRETQFLREKIGKSQGIRWKIITLVRDPIRTYFSKLFHEPKVHYPYLMNEQGKLKEKDELIRIILEELSNFKEDNKSSVANWFEQEFKPALGVDLYEFPFDDGKGYQIINYKNLDILVLRLEELNKNFELAINEFLNIETEIPTYTANVNNNKKQSSMYKEIISNIRIPQSILEEIYTSKYSQHFYGKAKIQQFLNQWIEI